MDEMTLLYEILMSILIMTGWAWIPAIIGKLVYMINKIITKGEYNNEK